MSNQNITPDQALMNLYTASTKAPLTKQDHDLCMESAKVLQEAITPKKEESKKK